MKLKKREFLGLGLGVIMVLACGVVAFAQNSDFIAMEDSMKKNATSSVAAYTVDEYAAEIEEFKAAKDELVKNGNMTESEAEEYILLMEQDLAKLIDDNGAGKFEILKPLDNGDAPVNAVYVDDEGAVFGSMIAGEDVGTFSSSAELEKAKEKNK